MHQRVFEGHERALGPDHALTPVRRPLQLSGQAKGGRGDVPP